MALKALVKDLAEVPEGIRGEYKQVTADGAQKGMFVLDVTPQDGFELDNVAGLKSALGAARGERDTATGALKAFEGLDAQAARDALTKLKEFETLDPKKEADKLAEVKVASLKTQIEAAAQAEVAKAQERAKALTGTVEKLLKTAPISEALSKAGGHPILARQLADEIVVKEQTDGTFAIEVVDSKGNPRIKDVQGNLMSVEDRVAELKADSNFAQFFAAPSNQGGNTPPQGNGNTTPPLGAYTRQAWLDKTSRATPDERQKLLADAAAGKIQIT